MKLTDKQKSVLGNTLTGLTDGLGVAASLAQINDTSGQESLIEGVGNTQFAGDTNSLLASFDANNMARTNYTGDEIRGFTDGQLAGSILTNTAKGALSGALKGGWVGALVEGGANLVGGTAGALVGNQRAHARANELNKLAEQANKQYLNSFSNAVSNNQNKMFNNSLLNIAAYGGPLFNHSGSWSNGLIFINEGGTHEQNPLGGVPVGVDQEGTPNLVEEGEVIYNDYVFSNRLKPSKRQIEKVGLKPKYEGKTFAEIVTDLQKESSETLDFISQNTLKDMMGIVRGMQEEVRAKKEGHKDNVFDEGGWKKTLEILAPVIQAYNNQNTEETEEGIQSVLDAETAMLETQLQPELAAITNKTSGYVDRLRKNVDAKYGEGFFDYSQSLKSSDTPLSEMMSGLNKVNKKGAKTSFNFDPSHLRYAPILADAASLINNTLSKPDYTNANAGLEAMQRVPMASVNPIGGKQSYTPIDRNYLLNQHLNASRGNLRAYQNMGVNAAQAAGLMLANNAATQNGIGESLLLADRENFERRMQTAQFNSAIDQYNATQSMQAQGLNMQRGYNIAQAAANAGQLREAIDATRSQAISSNLSGLTEGLAGIGTEAVYSDWLKGLTDTGALQDMYKYRKTNNGKYGGRLMTKKK